MLQRVGLGIVCVSLLALAGCGVSTPTSQGPQTVKIWVIAPLSEWAATYGQDAINAYQEIVAKNNDEDYAFELVVEDGKCSGKDAVSAAQKLINVDKVQVIVWGICSSETIPAAAIADQNKVVMISPTSSSPDISGISPYVFRYWNDLDTSKVLVSTVDKLDLDSITLIYTNNEYAVAYANAIKAQYKGTIVQEIKFDDDEKDFSLIAKKVASTKADAQWLVFIPIGDVSAIALLRALDAEGLLDHYRGKLVGSETMATNTVAETLGDRIDGAISVTLPEAKDLWAGAQTFIDMFAAKYPINSSPVFVVIDADAMQLAINAIKKVGNNADAVRNYIAGFTANKPIAGLLGKYYFNDTNDGQWLKFAVKTFADGKLVDFK